ESIQAFAATITPTLPAGVMWHTVQPEENIITIAVDYNADVKTLSELNREIDFARCDFGQRFGGAECIVQLFQGQRLRVPAPTPTPTLSPTVDPNATATPTATPTFNRPSPYSPADQSIFYVDELITLRWTPSGTLNPGEAYRVDVVDETSGITYTAYTEEIFFIIPQEWQGTQQQRHEFTWRVGIVSTDSPDAVRYQTETQRFTWQGNVEDQQ
ncbi:MAG: LysM peptidoglycan-binding domain-containing protein, partial [Anaerolineae bacterium]|nr:LysM peptidoglycan-binding domain-containing protein [Anaerolineae bacterium]